MQQTRITVLFHPLDPQSYELVKQLHSKSYTGKVDLLPAFTPGLFLRVFPWSTPSVYTITGQSLALSPLTPEEVIEIADGRSLEDKIYDDEDLFVSSIHKSTYASAFALVWGSFKPLLYNCGFLTPALRLRLRKVSCSDIQTKLGHNVEALYERSWKSIAVALAYSLVRDFYISTGFNLTLDDLEKLTDKTIALWLISKATVGMVGSPLTIINRAAVDYISEYLASRSYSILESIQQSIRKIMSDREYMKIVNREVKWFYPFIKMSDSI